MLEKRVTLTDFSETAFTFVLYVSFLYFMGMVLTLKYGSPAIN